MNSGKQEPKWRRWFRRIGLPYLYLWVDMGWVTIGTEVMYYSYTDCTYRYVTLHVRVFEWGGQIRLYRPDRY